MAPLKKAVFSLKQQHFPRGGSLTGLGQVGTMIHAASSTSPLIYSLRGHKVQAQYTHDKKTAKPSVCVLVCVFFPNAALATVRITYE